MKQLSLILFLFNTIFVAAQTVNQFDDNGKRHGIWKKNFEGTKVLRYEGQFNHGKEIGTFKFYKNIRGKAVLTASKAFNELDNKADVKFFSSKGKLISEGPMDGKKYIGEWKYYHNNSDKIMTLEFYNDKGNLHGEKYVYYSNGRMAEKQNYVDGKLEGEAIWYSIKNVVLKHFIYVNDELHGVSKYYNSKGELVAEGRYKLGKKHGIWKYYENGKLIEEKDFTPKSKYKKKKKLPN
ncbi:toxin-antitoxin system YwqK family antitoxin [Seonamhaeicola maritimus]|uniref:Toxin-antitoxin system YwqK family antitoxin n=1 Tax=Seonamhaeicola maritimus TaxID=2591822 RepID=A0A5C7GLH1_9FLAO|nr:toxin-antitoxin system YwqK family antitoxin [Seonamhaeicola maritimus]TXG38937.1 toxin-antitoxin system YwqK family antitoxin [Seonamhaeicola maritimus]